jgi:hypothetical protein
MSALGKAIKWTILAVLLVPVLALGSCVAVLWAGSVRYHWNQKMTVTVETPAGKVSGSAVIRLDWGGSRGVYAHMIRGLDGAKSSWSVTGEAVAVEVLPGRWLFALLKGPELHQGFQAGDPGSNLTSMIAVPKNVPYSTVEAMKLVRAFPNGEKITLSRKAFERPGELPTSTLPLLVTFGDIADPTSVSKVDPRDLEASFGPGVSLTAITVEKTDQALTEGRVEGMLPWLAPRPEQLLGPPTGEDEAAAPLYARLTMGDFIRRQQ